MLRRNRSRRRDCGSSRSLSLRRSRNRNSSSRNRRSRSRNRCSRSPANHRNHRVDLDRIPRLNFNRAQNTSRRRRNFRVHFIRRNLKQRLIALNGITNLLQPLGNRALKNRLAHLRHHHIHSRASSRRSSRNRRSRSRSRRNRCSSLRLSSLSSRSSSSPRTGLINHRDHSIDLHRRPIANLDLFQNPSRRRRNFRVHLIRRNLKQRLIALHRIARLFQPFGNRPLKNRLAHLGHHNIRRHRNLLPLPQNLMATRIRRATSDYKAKKQPAFSAALGITPPWASPSTTLS